MPRASFQHVVVATESGYLSELDALAVGVASWRLGAGRERKEDPVSFGAGIELHAQLGESVAKGAKLMTLHSDSEEKFDRALNALHGGWVISNSAVPDKKIILERVS